VGQRLSPARRGTALQEMAHVRDSGPRERRRVRSADALDHLDPHRELPLPDVRRRAGDIIRFAPRVLANRAREPAPGHENGLYHPLFAEEML
jgi:hypothetical protein